MKIERRTYKLEELRVKDADGKPAIEGHAAVFNKLSDDLGGFREKIQPGAFKKTLKEADIRALFNHDPNFVLGRNKSGTLELKEDKTGLWFNADPPDTQWARDLLVSIKRGDIDQASFGFRVIDDKMDLVDEQNIRTLREVQLFDVSPVTFPAYPQTDVSARSMLFDMTDFQSLEVRLKYGLPLTDLDLKLMRKITDVFAEHLEAGVDHLEGRDADSQEPGEDAHSEDVMQSLMREMDCRIRQAEIIIGG